MAAWEERTDERSESGETYGEILRISSAARASLLRAEHDQLHLQLHQLRLKAAGAQPAG